MLKSGSLAALAALALAGSTHALASGYAEGIYGEYAAASGGAISFDLGVLETGPLNELAGQPISQFTGTPAYIVIVDNADLHLENVQILPVERVMTGYLDDLSTMVDGFAEVGFPLALGEYRLLQVRFKDGDDTREHIALEACWARQGHCVVFDPAIEFLDSEVNNLRSLRASGWAPQVFEEPAEWTLLPDGGDTISARCGLASNPNAISKSTTWGRRTRTYKNLLGITMVSKTIGEVRTGVRCDSSCRPAPFGHSHNSSAWANVPFSVACGAASRGGTSGSTGRYAGRSGCAHRTVLGAKFTATAKGVGLSVDVQIDSTGSVDVNGGVFQDSCRYF